MKKNVIMVKVVSPVPLVYMNYIFHNKLHSKRMKLVRNVLFPAFKIVVITVAIRMPRLVFVLLDDRQSNVVIVLYPRGQDGANFFSFF